MITIFILINYSLITVFTAKVINSHKLKRKHRIYNLGYMILLIATTN